MQIGEINGSSVIVDPKTEIQCWILGKFNENLLMINVLNKMRTTFFEQLSHKQTGSLKEPCANVGAIVFEMSVGNLMFSYKSSHGVDEHFR